MSMGRNDFVLYVLFELLLQRKCTDFLHFFPSIKLYLRVETDNYLYIVYKIIHFISTGRKLIIGLKVLILVCDGATPNRKFFKMH